MLIATTFSLSQEQLDSVLKFCCNDRRAKSEAASRSDSSDSRRIEPAQPKSEKKTACVSLFWLHQSSKSANSTLLLSPRSQATDVWLEDEVTSSLCFPYAGHLKSPLTSPF
ncbi:hypothetical protein AVEN_147897-1 [Araneus ventricosus]|uniref:Uncharacterized protein n=1 Tax=Araneus ventricosus TaxID=182803 RepID=A0A4Y2DWZ1_ARAVE|nr:hypothetical protein AVEN_147897-1 [Araneus ventricosus]